MKFIYYSSKQTAKEIKEEGLKLKRYYKVLLLLFTFILISSGVHAKGINFFHFNESLCSCTAGTGSNFNYADWFNQGLNTTSNVTFGNALVYNSSDSLAYKRVDIRANDGITQTLINIDPIFNYTQITNLDAGFLMYKDFADSHHGFYMNYDINNNVQFVIENNNYDYTPAITFNTYDNSIQINQLSGSGNAFACLNENGTLYRSATACN